MLSTLTWPCLARWWAYPLLAAALAVAATTDLRRHKIYNWTTYPAILVGLVGHALVGWLAKDPRAMGLGGALAGLGIGMGPLALAWLVGGMNAGDIKLMGAVGALAGWRFAVEAMFFGFVVAVIMAFVIMIRHRVLKETLGRIFRYLALSFTPAKPEIKSVSAPGSRKVPFGFALCLGALAALAEVLVRGPEQAKLILGI